jgi:hypothetical protein
MMRSQDRNWNRAGAWVRSWCRGCAGCCWRLAPHDFLSLLSYRTRDPQPRVGPTHNGLGPPMWIVNQANAMQTLSTINWWSYFLNWCFSSSSCQIDNKDKSLLRFSILGVRVSLGMCNTHAHTSMSFLVYVCVCVCVCVCVWMLMCVHHECAPWHECGGQRITSDVFTFHLVWDRASRLFFCSACQASWLTSLRGSSCVHPYVPLGMLGLAHLLPGVLGRDSGPFHRLASTLCSTGLTPCPVLQPRLSKIWWVWGPPSISHSPAPTAPAPEVQPKGCVISPGCCPWKCSAEASHAGLQGQPPRRSIRLKVN